MPAYSVERDAAFRNPDEEEQSYTVGYRITGPRVSGHVWVTPHVANHDAYLQPTGMTIRYGKSTSVSGLVINGVSMAGSVRIDTPGEDAELRRPLTRSTRYGAPEPASPIAQAAGREILRLVAAAYLADVATVAAQRAAYAADLAPRRLALVEAQIQADDEQISRRTAARAKRVQEAERLRAFIG